MLHSCLIGSNNREGGEERVDYNWVGCEDWVLMVGREKEFALEMVSVNSLGKVGVR